MLLWFVTFLTEWHIRTGWQQWWIDGAIQAWANFAMLGWVEKYQTLLAGVLALGGGAAIVAATMLQRSHQIADRRDEDYRRTYSTMWSLRRAWGAARLRLHRGDDLGRVAQVLTQIEIIAGGLPFSADHVGQRLGSLATIGNTHIDLNQQNDVLELHRIIFVACTYLSDPDRLFFDGQLVHIPATIDNEEDLAEADSLQVFDTEYIWVHDLLIDPRR